MLDFFQFFSKNFELTTVVFVTFMVVWGVMIILTKLFNQAKTILMFAESILSWSIFLVSLTTLSLLGWIYWLNFVEGCSRMEFPLDVAANTKFVDEPVDIIYSQRNKLFSVFLNGSESYQIFEAPSQINSFHFSPDGERVVIVCDGQLYLLIRDGDVVEEIEFVKDFAEVEGSKFKVAISDIEWSPESDKFVYQVSKWSQFAGNDSFYVYDILKKEKRKVKNPAKKLESLRWNTSGDALYYLQYDLQSYSLRKGEYIVRVNKVPIDTLLPEKISEFKTDQRDMAIDHLSAREISLFLDNVNLSFGRFGRKEDLRFNEDTYLSIDKKDFLLFSQKWWFDIRLIKVPRRVEISDVPHHPYKGGDLTVRQIRWVPNGKYVLMYYDYLGIIVLDPWNDKMGLLLATNADILGWYYPSK